MKKLSWFLVLLMVLALPAQGVWAETADTQTPYLPAEYTAEFEKAVAALQAHAPDAAVDYSVRERDDSRYEWDLFFVLNEQLGVCEVSETDFSVHRVQLYELPEGALTASQVVEALAQEKGDILIVELELDLDDDRLRYEGTAKKGEKDYEFTLAIDGKLIEWERD